MAKKQRRRNNAERSKTARTRGKTPPLVFNFGGKTVEIVFEDDPTTPTPPVAPKSTPPTPPPWTPGPGELPFVNDPG